MLTRKQKRQRRRFVRAFLIHYGLIALMILGGFIALCGLGMMEQNPDVPMSVCVAHAVVGVVLSFLSGYSYYKIY